MTTEAILKFNMQDADEREAFKQAFHGTDLYLSLVDVRNTIFRPARKHGYSDSAVAELIALIEDQMPGTAAELIGRLEQLFNEILQDNNLGGFNI